MGSQSLRLYVSGSTWLALGKSPLTPLHGAHADPLQQKWDVVLQQIGKQLGKVNAVSIILSARLCHFVVLPWTPQCDSGAAIRRYVADAFAVGQGVSPDSHQVQILWPDYGAPIFAIAYPRALGETLQSALSAAGYKLSGIATSAMPILARYASTLGQGPRLLAYAEDDGFTAITLEEGRVAYVETLAPDGHGLDDLTVWASRKRMAFANDGSLHWLATSPPPGAFVGLALQGTDKPVSAAHAVVAACR
ncbi:hypothetical protein [Lysobacter terrae]